MAETRATGAPPDPETTDDTVVGRNRTSTPGTSRWQNVVGIIGLVVALWVGSETYDVVVGDFGGGGPGGGNHGPGQDTPVEDQDQEIDSDDGGGGDTPPAGGHG